MSKTPINTILKWLSVADMFVMIEYIPFTIYTTYIRPSKIIFLYKPFWWNDEVRFFRALRFFVFCWFVCFQILKVFIIHGPYMYYFICISHKSCIRYQYHWPWFWHCGDILQSSKLWSRGRVCVCLYFLLWLNLVWANNWQKDM